MSDTKLDWISVGHVDDLPEGRVKTVTAFTTSICLVHFDGQWAAMDNRCPHQNGPLGEGSIETGVNGKCWLRCPWHGWDFDPLTGQPPGGHEDSGQKKFQVDIRDGEIFVGLEPELPQERTVTDVMVETMANWGEIGAFCSALGNEVKPGQNADDQITELSDRWRMWRAEKQSRLAEQHGSGIHSFAIFDAVSKLAPKDAIFAVDVGNNTYSFGRYLETKGTQRVLMSGYLGSIGFGFPAGMGAWAATQDIEVLKGRKVISVSGDGGFGQYPMEFTTAVKYGMDITHILLNNGQLGKISKEQRAGEWPVWETNLVNPSFAAFARLCGGHGERITDADDIDAAIIAALEINGPALIEFMTDADLV